MTNKYRDFGYIFLYGIVTFFMLLRIYNKDAADFKSKIVLDLNVVFSSL